MPDEEDPNMKKRGRVYVCDLAGTEPAGDIYYANYENKKMPDGTVEVEAEGDESAVGRLAEFLAEGPRGARVDSVDREPMTPTGGTGFRIRR